MHVPPRRTWLAGQRQPLPTPAPSIGATHAVHCDDPAAASKLLEHGWQALMDGAAVTLDAVLIGHSAQPLACPRP